MLADKLNYIFLLGILMYLPGLSKHLLLSFLTLSTISCLADDSSNRPGYLGNTIIKNYYDGQSDDLLTAGWSNSELTLRKLPERTQQFDKSWLRKAAYYNNIIPLIDTTIGGGYGRIFGPDTNQKPISGFEYLGYSIDKSGQVEASLMLQIPDTMNTEKPCIIVAASSGSRGIYGAVGTVGTWALTNDCAIAYTDKGTGTGFYFFDAKKGYDVQGNYVQDSNINPLIYSQKITEKNKRFIQNHPQAIATKQSYSRSNIEKDFGRFVIQAGEFALYQLNEHFASLKSKTTKSFTKENTTIIAASISNGGVSSLKAGEQDSNQLFDGIVVSEPNIYPKKNEDLSIVLSGNPVQRHSMPGYDYFIAINLYSPCALLTDQAASQPFSNGSKAQIDYLDNWCQNLKSDGLIEGESTTDLAESSLKKLSLLGIQENSQTLSPLMQITSVWPALAATYTNQLGRFSIEDNVCSIFYSAKNKTGQASFLTDEQREALFATSNGIPPTAGVQLVSTDEKQSAYQTAKCFYDLSITDRLRSGVKELISTGNLNNIPTIILHGRNDSLVAPNHTSRAYYANLKKMKNNPNTRYYEITNAQHFDAFTSLPQYADKYIPLHYYFEQAVDLMMAHLEDGTPLPPSQVVNTKTRQKIKNKTEDLSLKHLPAITRKSKSLIQFTSDKENGDLLIIPE